MPELMTLGFLPPERASAEEAILNARLAVDRIVDKVRGEALQRLEGGQRVIKDQLQSRHLGVGELLSAIESAVGSIINRLIGMLTSILGMADEFASIVLGRFGTFTPAGFQPVGLPELRPWVPGAGGGAIRAFAGPASLGGQGDTYIPTGPPLTGPQPAGIEAETVPAIECAEGEGVYTTPDGRHWCCPEGYDLTVDSQGQPRCVRRGERHRAGLPSGPAARIHATLGQLPEGPSGPPEGPEGQPGMQRGQGSCPPGWIPYVNPWGGIQCLPGHFRPPPDYVPLKPGIIGVDQPGVPGAPGMPDGMPPRPGPPGARPPSIAEIVCGPGFVPISTGGSTIVCAPTVLPGPPSGCQEPGGSCPGTPVPLSLPCPPPCPPPIKRVRVAPESDAPKGSPPSVSLQDPSGKDITHVTLTKDLVPEKVKYLVFRNPVTGEYEITNSPYDPFPTDASSVFIAEFDNLRQAFDYIYKGRKPPEKVETPDGDATGADFDYSTPDKCVVNEAKCGYLTAQNPAAFSDFFYSKAKEAVSKRLSQVGMVGWAKKAAGAILNALTVAVSALADTFLNVVSALAGLPQDVILAHSVRAAVLRASRFFLGPAGDRKLASLEYQINNCRPSKILTPTEALEAYLTGQLKQEEFLCATRSHGFFDEWITRLARARRSKRTVGEILTLYRAGIFKRGEAEARLRELGFLEPSKDLDELLKATEFFPSPTDLITLTVRDVFDENLVRRFNLDVGFQEKIGGVDLARRIAQRAGISLDTLKLYWRAHWVIPSPTQLFQWYQRRRQIGVPPEQDEAWQIVRDALAWQDILPYWQEALREVAFNVLTRTDALRAYNIGALSDDDLADVFKRNGYSDPDIQRLVRFYQIQRMLYWDNNRWVKLYISGAINEETLRERMREDGAPDTLIERVVDRARRRIADESRRHCINAIRRRALIGEITEDEAIQLMLDFGLDQHQARWFARGFMCEMLATGKTLSAEKLCSLADAGLITYEEMQARLQRLGYTARDARLVAHLCALRRQTREAKAQQQAERRQEKQQKLRESEIERALRAKYRREMMYRRLLADAVFLISKRFGLDPDQAGSIIEQAREALTDQKRWSAEEVVLAIVRAAKLAERHEEITAKALELAEVVANECVPQHGEVCPIIDVTTGEKISGNGKEQPHTRIS